MRAHRKRLLPGHYAYAGRTRRAETPISLNTHGVKGVEDTELPLSILSDICRHIEI